jgi:hypothetical protein
VDIGIGLVLVFTGTPFEGDSPVPVFAICLAVGALYLALGVIIALVKLQRQAGQVTLPVSERTS